MERGTLEQRVSEGPESSRIWTPGNNATIWTSDSKDKVPYAKKGRTVLLPELRQIYELDEDQQFFWMDYLKEIWGQLSERMKLRFDMDGLIGLGKSTIPKIMRLYMNALLVEEEKDSVNLKLFYHDMDKYAFPFNLYLVAKERPRLISNGLKRNSTFILDRSPKGERHFIRTLRGRAISENDAETLTRILEDQQVQNGNPDVLVMLEGKPNTGYKRATKRGYSQEVGNGEGTAVTQEIREAIARTHEEYLQLIAEHTPEKLARYRKLFAEELPSVLKGGGLTLGYQKSLSRAYSDYEDTLQQDSTVFLRINVDKVRRSDFTHQVTIMNALKYATFKSLENQGYRVEEEVKRKRVHVFDYKGEKIT